MEVLELEWSKKGSHNVFFYFLELPINIFKFYYILYKVNIKRILISIQQ